MVFPNPSIQSFYQKDRSSSATPGSGENEAFTPAEVEAALRPVTQTWRPRGEYHTVNINELQPGQCRVRFSGRIVNFSHAKDASTKHTLPEGFHFLVVKDDTGVVAIRLLASGDEYECIQLGTLVTVWSAFVGECSASAALRVPLASVIVPVHPSQTSASCIKFHRGLPGSGELTLFRRPLDFDHSNPSSQMPGLMNLKAYLDSGHEGVPGAKVLVCVSSIGPRRLIKPRPRQGDPDPSELDLVEVNVFDETTSCIFTLWNMASSARTWVPNQTVLLLSNPRFRPGDKGDTGPGLGISICSLVELDPAFPDADWLRQMALSRTKRECVYIPFPEGVWDAEEAVDSSEGPLFTLAEVDELARVENKPFTGNLSLVILAVRIVENRRVGKLCCTECCGVPLYANRPKSLCKNCNNERTLALNPRIIGALADETGTISIGKLIWADKAWAELLFGKGTYRSGEAYPTVSDSGCSWQELVSLDLGRLRAVEEQLQYSRVMLTFGWSSEVGRLCVLGVEWQRCRQVV